LNSNLFLGFSQQIGASPCGASVGFAASERGFGFQKGGIERANRRFHWGQAVGGGPQTLKVRPKPS